MELKFIETNNDLEKVLNFIKKVSNSVDNKQLEYWIKGQRNAGYEIGFMEHENEIAVLAGFRIIESLQRGKSLMVLDMFTDSKFHYTGLEQKLISELKTFATETDCSKIVSSEEDYFIHESKPVLNSYFAFVPVSVG